jgi:general stress protein YciG
MDTYNAANWSDLSFSSLEEDEECYIERGKKGGKRYL